MRRCQDCLLITLMVFIAMIMNIFNYGKTIDEIITYRENQLELVEDLGVGLIEYDSRVNGILDKMLEKKDTLSGAMSFTLKIDKIDKIDNKFQIDKRSPDSIEPYLKDLQLEIDPESRAIKRLGSVINVNMLTGDITQTPEQALLADELSKEWRPGQLMKDKSYPEEGHINIMLETFMPKIISMANKGIPKNIQFSGNSITVSRSPFGPQNFHQDVDQQALLSPAFADNDYRIMIFDRDKRYDREWTQIATEIDGETPSKYIKKRFPSYDHAKLIGLELGIDKSKYMALVFDNNKVFHRTPPTEFWDWVFGNIPKQRRVTQFRIAWDDNEQKNYEAEWGEKRFEEIMEGGGYKIYNRQGKRNTLRRSVKRNTSKRSIRTKKRNTLRRKTLRRKTLRNTIRTNKKHINVNYDLYNYLDKRYGIEASNWYENNPTLPHESNPFIPTPEAPYVPLASNPNQPVSGTDDKTEIALPPAAILAAMAALGIAIKGAETTWKLYRKYKQQIDQKVKEMQDEQGQTA